VHDLLLAIGDLTPGELSARVGLGSAADTIASLAADGRILSVSMAGEARYIAVEDAARYRDALGVALTQDVPAQLLEPSPDALENLAMRFARTHAPFTASTFATRYGLETSAAEALLGALARSGRLLEGEFRPGGTEREWTDPGVLRSLRSRSLARLRREVEPVEPAVLARFLAGWHRVVKRQHGADALLDAVDQLQGAPLPASILETEILAARIDGYDPADLDAVTASGDVVWAGLEPIGDRDGRVALYLADSLPSLLPPPPLQPPQQVRSNTRGRLQPAPDPRETRILDFLRAHGASFFAAVHDAAGGGYPAETVAALWRLVWSGLVTNDTFHALRAFTQAPPSGRRARTQNAATPHSRRQAPPSGEGRWTLVPTSAAGNATAWVTAAARQLLVRHGVVSRESLAAESIPGGFATVYPVLKTMEETGRVRRGYFVAGLGAAQFALPGAVDLLRSLRDPSGSGEPEVAVLAATDPANPYGATLRWPPRPSSPASTADAEVEEARPMRAVGATVIVVDGGLAAFLARGDRQLLSYLPDDEPVRSRVGRAIGLALIERARFGGDSPRGMLIESIDGVPAARHPLAPYLAEAGFLAGALGFQATFPKNVALTSRQLI
jgi:ATP-dependent Lhr-like helicase